jgi:glutathione reductase (NADPH)
MAKFDFDLFTLGAGSGGVAASRRAGAYGARVAICEERRVGGTCVLRGCVPKKLLVYASHLRDELADAAGYGWTIGDVSVDWSRTIAIKNKELDRLEQVYLRLLGESGVEVMRGRGTIVGPHTVDVEGRHFTAERILVATGGWPTLPEVPGIEHAITSNEALDLERVPEHVVIVGGGYIALEFSGIWHGAGAEVTLVVRGDEILRGFDRDVRDALTEQLRKRGITIECNNHVNAIEKRGDKLHLRLDRGEARVCDTILYATGRHPHSHNIGLETVGVALDHRGAIIVDEWSRTNVPGIWAVGDVTHRLALTPVAVADGRAFAETEFNTNPTPVDHGAVPTAVFSQPPIGTVGLTEEEARELGVGTIDVYRARFRPMKYVMPDRDEQTMMKLVVDRDTDRVLGLHMVGPDAAEIVQGFAVAIKAGATKKQFDATVGIHPTSAEEFVTMAKPVTVG